MELFSSQPRTPGDKQGRMSKMKGEARLPKAVQPAADPLVKVCGVEDIRSKSPKTFNLTKRSKMTTMEAKEAPPGLESKSAFSKENGKTLSSPMLLGSLELAQPIPAHGSSNSVMDDGCHLLLGSFELAQLASVHGASNSLIDEGCHMLLGSLELAQLAFAHGASKSLRDEGSQIQECEKQEVTGKDQLPCDKGSARAPHSIVQISSQSGEAEHGSTLEAKRKMVIDDWGKAPMGITLKTAGLTPPCRKNCGPTESESEDRKSDDLSKARAGSVIHTLYEQLLAAGDKELTLEELLASIQKKQKAWQSYDYDWEHEVQFHVENNPHTVQEIKRYRLRPYEQPDLQRQFEPSTNVMCMDPIIGPDTTANDLELSMRRSLQCDIHDPAPPPRATRPVFPINHPKGRRSRRKACQKETIAVSTQLATELEKTPIQESEVQEQMAEWIAAWVPDPSILEPPTCMQILNYDAQRKCSSNGNEQPDWPPIQKTVFSQMQSAKALAKQREIMTDVHCNRRDVPEEGIRPLNALEVSKLCEHHYSKDTAKRARYMAHESQQTLKKASLDSKGCPRLPAFEMHSNEVPLVVTKQPVESNPVSSVGSVEKLVLELNSISSVGSVSSVKSEVDHNLDEFAQRLRKVHFKGNVRLKDSDFKEIMELHVMTTANKRPFLVAKMTPASTVAVKIESNGQPKAELPPTIPPQSPPHGVKRNAAKTRSMESL